MIYTTTQGDVWDLISYKVYNDEGFTEHLINANPAHRHTVIFSADVVLNVPDKPTKSSIISLPPWKQR
ncbi:MAG: tail protein X [Defluviitaleaceae bacterium]|nr:tail protein X [Defluviitaleaceae bacterium]